MKQHISIEQLNELSKKGKERLRKWCFNYPEEDARWDNLELTIDGKTTVNLCEDNLISEWLEKAYPILSIGQMIEFLVEEQKKHPGKYYKKDDRVLSIMLAIPDIRPIGGLNWQGELANALWEACKDILNGK